jgi:hypothetical protein
MFAAAQFRILFYTVMQLDFSNMREEHRFVMSENEVLRKMCQLVRREVTGEWRILCSK